MCGFISELSVFLFCFVLFCFPLIYISVSVPVPYCLDDCGFVVEPEVVILFNLLAAFIKAVCFLLPGGGGEGSFIWITEFFSSLLVLYLQFSQI